MTPGRTFAAPRKGGDVLGRGVIVKSLPRPDLLEVAHVQHRYASPNSNAYLLIVGNEYRRHCDLLQQRTYLASQVRARLRVERAKRFVE